MPSPKKKSFQFHSTLQTIKGAFIATAIFLPDEIIEALPEGRVRAKGTINDVPFNLAPQFKKDGRRYFAISAAFCRAAKIKVGSPVNVKFKLVDPEVLKLPEELEAVLAQDEEAMQLWKEFTTGLQRSLAHYVTSVKNVDSRIKRSLELAEKIKAKQLSVQKVKKSKDADDL